MTCRELADRVMAYRDRELPLPARLSLQLHAAMCPCCRTLLQSYGTTIELSAELATVVIPDEVARDFNAMILAAMEKPPVPGA